MDMMFTCYSHLSFSFQLLCTHMFLGLCTYVRTGRRVEESCACICFYVCVSSESGDGSS
jgi:hypothetical protein